MPSVLILKVIYYVAIIAFHLLLLFTNAGNYVHGGTPAELIVLQAGAVLIFVATIKLLLSAGAAEKILMSLCAVIPAIFAIGFLILLIGK